MPKVLDEMANGLNKAMVIGHLGRDPEIRYSSNGQSVANFPVACNRTWKNTEGKKVTETEWFTIVAWGNLAETAEKILKKGSHVFIEGRIKSRSWQDNHGNRQKSFEIVAQEILLLSESPANQINDELSTVE